MSNTRTTPGFALLVRTDGQFTLLDWPASDDDQLKILYAACNCDHVDAVQITETLTMWLDDEGMINQAAMNPGATHLYSLYRPLHQGYYGHALFTGGADLEGNTLGLTKDEAAHLVEQYLTAGIPRIPAQRTARTRAIEEGELVDAPRALCREAGFRVPVALTKAAWEDCVAWSEADDQKQRTVQDETGRLWDVLMLARLSIARSKGLQAHVTLHRIKRDGHSSTPRLARLVAEIGPGDRGEPVITIKLPTEI
ncbi:DUF6573 family protein [Streptomyces sp. NPDC016845]|uniref:DUF6573 family protein n=1 Tax=Streptomyces sp. NPDC016845 TaxID=3364972 RepID=UPI003798EB51